MAKNNLHKMRRKDLIEIIYALQQEEEAEKDVEIELPTREAVAAERARLNYRGKYGWVFSISCWWRRRYRRFCRCCVHLYLRRTDPHDGAL
ncbi:MAG: hypothetical protein Q4C55_07530 [Eubacterium sp.]|nr:hypothetical protein [Eubacterium sp.]